jgi:DNA-binding MarR family transcriptional regulator
MRKRPLDQLYRRPGFMIRRAHQISVSLFLEETGELGITNRQYGIMLVLKAEPGMVLTKLEQAGFVGRVVGASDRRKRALKLTPAGERMLKRLAGPAKRAQERVLSAFSPKERQTFLDLLDKFARAFNATTRVPQVIQRKVK